MDVIVNLSQRRVYTGGKSYNCAIGRSGGRPSAQKTEGDGATPIGRWPIKRVFFRPDRTAPPQTTLPLVPLRPHDGWCDAPFDALYNRPVSLPYPASHERLWREDHVYDVIVELGHNDDPVVPERGSAVFIHISKPDFTPTEGCIALSRDDLLDILSNMSAETQLDIRSD